MKNIPSSEHSATSPLGKESFQQPNPLFVCRKDKTIPYLTFEIKDQDVCVTMHCNNSVHTRTEEYQSLEIKSIPKASETPNKKSKSIQIENDDSFGCGDKDREYLWQWCVKSHRRGFPAHNTQREEENKYIKVDYFCKQHRNVKQTYYCETCQTNVCVECKRGAHQTHDTFKVRDLLKNTNIPEWMKRMSQWEKGYYEDANKKYKAVQKQWDAAYERNIKVNGELFLIVKRCLTMFEQYKESYNINWYRNTANIANNFNFTFWKGLLKETKQSSSCTLNTASTIEYFSTQLILNISNIRLPHHSAITISHTWPLVHSLQIHSKNDKHKNTCFEEYKSMNVPGFVIAVCKLNESQFAVGCESPNDIVIVDVNSLNIIRTLKYHTGYIWRLHVHRQSQTLLSMSKDSSISVWDYSNGKWIRNLRGHTGYVNSVVEWNNGDIVTVCGGGLIKYWNMTEYKCYRTIENGSGLFDVIIKDKKWITACGYEGIKSFKEDTINQDDYVYQKYEGKWVLSLWLVEERWLAGCHDGGILIYDVKRFEFQGELKGHSSHVWRLILLSSGWVASGSKDCSLKIWDWEAQECRQTIELGDDVSTGWYEWDRNSIICGTCDDKAVKIFIRKEE